MEGLSASSDADIPWDSTTNCRNVFPTDLRISTSMKKYKYFLEGNISTSLVDKKASKISEMDAMRIIFDGGHGNKEAEKSKAQSQKQKSTEVIPHEAF